TPPSEIYTFPTRRSSDLKNSEEITMRKHTETLLTLFVCTLALVTLPFHAGAAPQKQEPRGGDLSKEVRHQLVLLPYYSVFDNLRSEEHTSELQSPCNLVC